jgi:coenzyme PQQ biosynthesis protein PqqD
MTSGPGSPEVAPKATVAPEAVVAPEAAAAPKAAVVATATPWTRESRPRLPSKVRLQWDEARNQAMLLFPEGVLILNPTANAVLELVDGTRSLGQIVSELTQKFDAETVPTTEGEAVDLSMDPGTDGGEHESIAAAPSAAPAAGGAGLAEREARIERDVIAFLGGLEERGWLVREPAA